MAISSNTGTVNGSDVTFTITDDIKGAAKGQGIISYVNYTLVAGDSQIEISYSYNNKNVDANYYSNIIVSSELLEVSKIKFSTSGMFRIPLAMATNEESVKVSIAGLVTGSLNIEFSIDQPYE